jgi:hypothetical protein
MLVKWYYLVVVGLVFGPVVELNFVVLCWYVVQDLSLFSYWVACLVENQPDRMTEKHQIGL